MQEVAVIEYLYTERDGRWSWRLILRLPTGAEVLARSADDYPDEGASRAAGAQLATVPGGHFLARQGTDGRWHWLCHGPDGHLLATSATTYPTAVACQHRISQLRGILAGAAQVPAPA